MTEVWMSRFPAGLVPVSQLYGGRAPLLLREMPVRRHAVARRVLAHGRDAVSQDNVAQLEGFEQMGHALIPDGRVGEV